MLGGGDNLYDSKILVFFEYSRSMVYSMEPARRLLQLLSTLLKPNLGRTISLRLLGIILRALRLEGSV